MTCTRINFTFLYLTGILLPQLNHQPKFLFAYIPFEVLPICTDTAIPAEFLWSEALLEDISLQRLHYLLRLVLDYFNTGGQGSVVGIATAYGLGVPRIESRWRRDFPHLSRPALRVTQHPVQWVPGISRGKVRLERDAHPKPPSSAKIKNWVELYLYSP